MPGTTNPALPHHLKATAPRGPPRIVQNINSTPTGCNHKASAHLRSGFAASVGIPVGTSQTDWQQGCTPACESPWGPRCAVGGFSEFLLGLEPRPDGRFEKPAFVLDCSGEDQGHRWCGGRTGKIPVLENLSSRAAAIFDLDGDGDLDLVTNEMNDRPQVLASNLSNQKELRYLKIKLIGTRSNRDALGAMVKVQAGGRTITQQHDGESGYLSQSSLPLYFGLGDSTQVDRIEIRWPSGQTQSVKSPIPINTLLVIQEGG